MIFWKDHLKALKAIAVNYDDLQETEPVTLQKEENYDISKAFEIILFRHFVCLIIHTAQVVGIESVHLKEKIEQIVQSLELSLETGKSVMEKDNMTQNSHSKIVTVPDWCKSCHEELIKKLCPEYADIWGRIEISIPVKVLYALLEEIGILKESS